jgi:glucose/arabinose dehydrogenase
MKITSLILLAPILIVGITSLNCTSTGNNHPNHSAAINNYQNFCAGCHGVNLERFALKPWMEEEGIQLAFESIKFGLEDLGMPAFEKTFSDTEIEGLAKYIKNEVPKDNLKPAITIEGIVTSEEYKFAIDTVVTGLIVPWGLAFLPNGDLLISERAGTLHRFSDGQLSAPIEGLPPIMAVGQGGLLDLALHPDYSSNGWIYIAYSALNTESTNRIGNTSIMRAKIDGNKLIDQQVIFEGTPHTSRLHHFGCKLAFDNQGHLFFGIGDRGQRDDFPQTLDNHNGKIHRIMDDGTIPSDNPFVNTPNALPSIYSYGHRNPQGTCIHPVTGEIWISEHGPKGGDELNLVEPGLNYGWPVISYGINYNGTIFTEHTHMEGMEQPIFEWTPSIAPCGMAFVTGDRFKKWENNLLVGSLSFKYLERVVLDGHSVTHREKLLEGIGRVRNVVMSPDGYVYVAIETPGVILRLIPVELTEN